MVEGGRESKVFDYSPDWGDASGWECDRPWRLSGLASPSHCKILTLGPFFCVQLDPCILCMCVRWFNYCLNISREDAVKSGDFRKPERFDP